jgi:hypothetical protein
MRHCTPQTRYDAKPWACTFVGSVLAIGWTARSLATGYWTVLRRLCLFGGAALAIVGGIPLQMRQDHRARNEWRRETLR